MKQLQAEVEKQRQDSHKSEDRGQVILVENQSFPESGIINKQIQVCNIESPLNEKVSNRKMRERSREMREI